MSKTSAFIGGSQLGAVKGEIRFGVLRGCVLLAGAVTLAVCPRDPTGASLLASGWLLILSAALSLMRPLVYPRGFADGVSALVSASFCALAGLFPELAGVPQDTLRLMLTLFLFFAGLTRFIAFAGTAEYSVLPCQLLCCLTDVVCAFLLLRSVSSGAGVYVYSGVALAAAAAESFCESAALSRLKAKE